MKISKVQQLSGLEAQGDLGLQFFGSGLSIVNSALM